MHGSIDLFSLQKYLEVSRKKTVNNVSGKKYFILLSSSRVKVGKKKKLFEYHVIRVYREYKIAVTSGDAENQRLHIERMKRT